MEFQDSPALLKPMDDFSLHRRSFATIRSLSGAVARNTDVRSNETAIIFPLGDREHSHN